jgi:hypothetical protein
MEVVSAAVGLSSRVGEDMRVKVGVQKRGLKYDRCYRLPPVTDLYNLPTNLFLGDRTVTGLAMHGLCLHLLVVNKI